MQGSLKQKKNTSEEQLLMVGEQSSSTPARARRLMGFARRQQDATWRRRFSERRHSRLRRLRSLREAERGAARRYHDASLVRTGHRARSPSSAGALAVAAAREWARDRAARSPSPRKKAAVVDGARPECRSCSSATPSRLLSSASIPSGSN